MATTGKGEGKRAYDSSRRRERADEERQATRRRVVEAASRLFVANGYVATTMADIAREAGVALQSVYKAGTSKAELLHLVVDRAVAGDDEEVMIADRQGFTDLADEPDPRKQVAMLAGLIASTQERSAPVQHAYRQAAAVDDNVAASLEAAHQRRLQTFSAVVGMIDPARLRLSPEECTDLAWAMGSPEVFQLMRVVRGWDADRYLGWLTQTLVDVLVEDGR